LSVFITGWGQPVHKGIGPRYKVRIRLWFRTASAQLLTIGAFPEVFDSPARTEAYDFPVTHLLFSAKF
jgi:hypothetical protein